MSTTKKYLGKDVLISYLREKSDESSYRGFLNICRDVVVSSLVSNDWRALDNTWSGRFLEEAKLLLDRKDFAELTKKVKSERLRSGLKAYWLEVIEECGRVSKRERNENDKENLLRSRSIITLICLVKGNTIANAFPVDIDREQLVGHLKEAIKEKKNRTFQDVEADRLKLWKVQIPDHDDQLSNISLRGQDELLATRSIEDYWSEKPVKRHIHVIAKFPLLSLEEKLSRIPLPISYSPECVKSKKTTRASGDPPTRVLLWEDFFEEVNRFNFDQQLRFKKPKFVTKEVMNEEDVRSVFDFNICQILNDLMPDCSFSRRPTHTTGIPDFNCHLVRSLIMVIEVKRKHVLDNIGDRVFPEFYRTNKEARTVIQQIYNYMGNNKLRYGILTTYDNHWFLRREHTELWISKSLPLQSESPPVLKAYAYLTLQAEENPHSPHPLVLIPAHGNTGSRILRSHLKSTSDTLVNTSRKQKSKIARKKS